ncbi:MAG: prolipoprotein diacylglyceryl transferase family protein [Pirellulaceae bacterium]
MRTGYALIILTALTAAFLLARKTQKGLSLQPMEKFGIGLGAFMGAMFGAKLPFLFDNWESFLNGTAWFSDGKTILTGLVGGYLGVEIAKWSLGVQTRTGDSFVLPVAVAIAIGRLGCFYAGCCYGQPTTLPWGIVFRSVDEIPRHPTQLYESLFHLAAAIVFWRLAANNQFPGQRVKLYIISYAVYRFFSEWLRPEARMYGYLTGYQLASLAIVALFCWLWWRDVRRSQALVVGAAART